MTDWLRIAFSGPVVRRGIKYAALVGALLVAINHGDTLLAHRITSGTLLKIALTVAVPYCVSVLSSVGATLDARTRAAVTSRPREGRS